MRNQIRIWLLIVSLWFHDLWIRLFWPALSFDDVLLKPGFTNFQREEADLRTVITKGGLALRRPFISAPMDYVTDAKMAIAVGNAGGLGILHRNYTIEEQAEAVRQIKAVVIGSGKEAVRLLAAAAIAVDGEWKDRLKALYDAGLDILVLDAANGWSAIEIKMLRDIKGAYPKLQVVAGNVATYEAALALIKAGADALRIGMGPGSICSTRLQTGSGVPQMSAILNAWRAARKYGVPIWADGGIRYPGDMAKALAAGAAAVMMGLQMAATDESAGEHQNITREEFIARFGIQPPARMKIIRIARYRGMGHKDAVKAGRALKEKCAFHGEDQTVEDNEILSEGVSGWVIVKGPVGRQMRLWAKGIRGGFATIGAKDIAEAQLKRRFQLITQASLQESHPHDILIEDDGGLY